MPVNCRTSGFSSSKQTLLVFFSHLSNMHCSIGLQIHYNSTIQLMQLIGKHMGTDKHTLSLGLSGGNRNKICFWPHTSAQTHRAPSCSISCSAPHLLTTETGMGRSRAAKQGASLHGVSTSRPHARASRQEQVLQAASQGQHDSTQVNRAGIRAAQRFLHTSHLGEQAHSWAQKCQGHIGALSW